MTWEEIKNSYLEKVSAEKKKALKQETWAELSRQSALRYQRLAAKKMGEYYKYMHYSVKTRQTHWTEEVIALLKEVNAITGLNFDYSDLCVFGLRCECPVFSHNGDEVNVMLVFTPDSDGELSIDTGKRKYDCVEGSIGDLNGFNNVTERVESIQTIIDNLRQRYPELNIKTEKL